jgi:hypothetical protein
MPWPKALAADIIACDQGSDPVALDCRADADIVRDPGRRDVPQSVDSREGDALVLGLARAHLQPIMVDHHARISEATGRGDADEQRQRIAVGNFEMVYLQAVVFPA